MIKKRLYTVLVFLLLFMLIGCGKQEKTSENAEADNIDKNEAMLENNKECDTQTYTCSSEVEELVINNYRLVGHSSNHDYYMNLCLAEDNPKFQIEDKVFDFYSITLSEFYERFEGESHYRLAPDIDSLDMNEKPKQVIVTVFIDEIPYLLVTFSGDVEYEKEIDRLGDEVIHSIGITSIARQAETGYLWVQGGIPILQPDLDAESFIEKFQHLPVSKDGFAGNSANGARIIYAGIDTVSETYTRLFFSTITDDEESFITQDYLIALYDNETTGKLKHIEMHRGNRHNYTKRRQDGKDSSGNIIYATWEYIPEDVLINGGENQPWDEDIEYFSKSSYDTPRTIVELIEKNGTDYIARIATEIEFSEADIKEVEIGGHITSLGGVDYQIISLDEVNTFNYINEASEFEVVKQELNPLEFGIKGEEEYDVYYIAQIDGRYIAKYATEIFLAGENYIECVLTVADDAQIIADNMLFNAGQQVILTGEEFKTININDWGSIIINSHELSTGIGAVGYADINDDNVITKFEYRYPIE